ncbi:MAG: hypothetical protein ACJAZC_001644 [Cryomorphaceae bacterium]
MIEYPLLSIYASKSKPNLAEALEEQLMGIKKALTGRALKLS